MGLERYEEAEREMRRAVDIDPDHPQPHLLLSQIYFRLGREEDAAREKQLSLRFRRENPTAMEALQGRPFPEK
jgi:Flp pilus assembly protein TadD